MAYGESPGGNNSHGGGGHQGGNVTDRRQSATQGHDLATRLRVDTLYGVVPPKNRTGAAVTINDVRPFLEVTPWMQGMELSVAPGAYDFNLLLKDVQMLYTAFEQFNNMVRKKGNFDGKLKPLTFPSIPKLV